LKGSKAPFFLNVKHENAANPLEWPFFHRKRRISDRFLTTYPFRRCEARGKRSEAEQRSNPVA
jgi:hypothetical protein